MKNDDNVLLNKVLDKICKRESAVFNAQEALSRVPGSKEVMAAYYHLNHVLQGIKLAGTEVLLMIEENKKH